MAGPWEAYAPVAEPKGPWSAYGPAQEATGGTQTIPGKDGEPTRVIMDMAPPDDHGLARRQAMSPVEKALSPFTEYWPTYQQMNKEAREQVSRGAEQIANPDSLIDPKAHGISDVLTGAANVAMGGLGYVASPISAAYRSIAGQPIEDVTGIPREYTETALQLATPGIGITKLPEAPGLPVNPSRFVPPSDTTIAPSPGQEAAAAANRLSATGKPVEISRAVASDSMPLQEGAVLASNVPLAGQPLVQSAKRTLEQLGTKADEVKAGFGGGTVEGSGEAAGAAIKNWITGESKANVTKLYDRVDNLVDPQTTTPLVNTRNVAAEIKAEYDAAHLQPGKAINLIEEAANADGLTYQGIKTLRTKIGEAMDSGILPEGMSGGDLKRIYGALTDDLRSSVLVGGSPKAVAEFDRANNYYKLVSDRREALAKIVGANGDVPVEKVFDRIKAMASSSSRADHAKLAQARKVMGADDWNEFVSGVVAKLGRDANGNFSPDRFITNYKKDLSESGRNILFRSGGKGDLAQHLDDIATVSTRFKELQRFANPSGSGRVGLAGGIGAGLMAAPLSTIATVLGAGATSYALSRPATAASVAKLVRAQTSLASSPSPARIAAYATASRNLISTLGDKAQGITVPDFMKALQGPVPARSQDEQR